MSSNSGDDHKVVQSDNIVGQLLRAKTDREQSVYRGSRVVVDEEGNKIVQVRKRKRVYAEQQPKKKGSSVKMFFLVVACFIIIASLLLGGLFVFRISSFNSEDFLASKQQELSEAWGAKVTLSSLKVEGFAFSLGSLVAEFPEDSNIKDVTIERLRGDLGLVSLVTGVFTGDHVSAAGVQITLRNDVTTLNIPVAKGKDIWKYKYFETGNFNLTFEDKSTAPFQLKGELYVRKTLDDADKHVVQLKGAVGVKGWPPIRLTSNAPIAYITEHGIEVAVNGVIGNLNAPEQFGDKVNELSSILLHAEIGNGTSIYYPVIKLEGRNLFLSDITQNSFDKIFSAKLGMEGTESELAANLTMGLPTSNMLMPSFEGQVHMVRDIQFAQSPIFTELTRILGSTLYSQLFINRGSLNIKSDGTQISISNINFKEDKLIDIIGGITAVPKESITGSLKLSVSAKIVGMETMVMDPIFQGETGDDPWIMLEISGTPDRPKDNSSELIASAAQKRASAPAVRLYDEQDKVRAREELRQRIQLDREKTRTNGPGSDNNPLTNDDPFNTDSFRRDSSNSSSSFDDILTN